MIVQPKDYEKVTVGTQVRVKWLGPGPQTTDTGTFLYVYHRPHHVTDENGRVIKKILAPARCGIELPTGDSLHYTNGFELHMGDE